MKQCPSCAAELPDSTTVCDRCGRPAADGVRTEFVSAATIRHQGTSAVEALSGDGASIPPPAGTTPQGGSAGPGHRELAMIAIGVVGGGLVMFALLAAGGAVSPDAAERHVNTSLSEPSSPAAPTPASLLTPKWTTGNRARWVGNERKSMAFEVAAASKVQVWLREVQPLLVVRCRARSAEAFVFTDSAVSIEPQDEDHTVRLQFDDGAGLTERWPDSLEHDALFAPDGAALALRLMSARSFRFGFTPHNAAPVMAEFDVSGLADLLTPAAAECGWTR